jgi:GMP synthase-like glutamine amidotransferase
MGLNLQANPIAYFHLVGICFGHQIIATAFGGRIERSQAAGLSAQLT